MFDPELGDTMRMLIELEGFDLQRPYAGQAEMATGIKLLADMPRGSALSATLMDALLENFRLAVLTTVSSGNLAAIAAQSTLPRWQWLHEASPAAARGYMRALRFAGLPIPATLREGT